MIHFTNSKGERLPEDINKVANWYYDPKFSGIKPNRKKELWLGNGFDWYKSNEGRYIWNNANNGNYQPFYDFHKQARKSEIIAEIEKLQNELNKL